MPDECGTGPKAAAPRGTSLLITGLGFLAVTVIVLFAPVLECPLCWMRYDIENAIVPGSAPKVSFFSGGCELCWRGRISVYRRWIDHHSPFYTDPFRN